MINPVGFKGIIKVNMNGNACTTIPVNGIDQIYLPFTALRYTWSPLGNGLTEVA